MPKLILVNVVVQTFQTFAADEDQALLDIQKFREAETEEPESGVKATQYRLGWREFGVDDPTEVRNQALLQFLELVKQIPPGIPDQPTGLSSNIIILPKGQDILTKLPPRG